MKKTWISIKRGLLKPEHREAIGVRVWLYMHMIDVCDWDTGRVEGWTDKEQAAKIDMPWRTVQRQRQELADAGYITCEQGFQCINIVISKWINPRSYSGDLVTDGGTQNCVPSEDSEAQGTQNCVPIPTENCVPFLISQIFNQYGVELPETLHTEEFCLAWQEWEEYRKEKRKKLTKTTVKRQVGFLAKFSDYAPAIIAKSILNGWQGLFEPDAAMKSVVTQKSAAPVKSDTSTGGVRL